jgi:hypothetical protein
MSTLLSFFIILCFLGSNIFLFGRRHYMYFVFWSTTLLYLMVMFLNKIFNLSPVDIKILYMIKELPVCLAILMLIINTYQKKIPNILIVPNEIKLFFLGCIVCFLYPNGQEFGTRLTAFRDLTTVFLAITVGMFVPIEVFNKKFLSRVIFSFVIFGIFELSIDVNTFWGFWGFLDLKGKIEEANSMYLSVGGFGADYSAFFNYDVLLFGMDVIRRLGLFYANAIEVGQLFSIFSLWAFALFMERRSLSNSILLILAFLLQIIISGKGGIAALLIGMIVIVSYFNRKVFIVLCGGMFIGVLWLIQNVFFVDGISFLGHIGGLVSGIINVTQYPLGTGLGTAGALITLNSNSAVGDSMVGNILTQGGMPLFLLFTYMHISLIRYLQKIYNQTNTILPLISFSLLIATYTCSFLTEAVYHYIATYFLFIMCGAVLRNARYVNKYKKKVLVSAGEVVNE